MKTIKYFAIIALLSCVATSCFGDKNTLIGQDFGDTSFVNKNFSGNKKDFAALPKNLCEFIPEAIIRSTYPDATKIMYDDGKTFASKSCRYIVYTNENTESKYDYLTGTIFAAEDPGDNTDEWKESWEMKKKMSKSSEYIPNLGKAAVWIGKKRELSIKMDGYTVIIMVPGSPFKKEEVAKKRDYKSIAIKIANSTGLF